jgi:hypothetical protein
MTACLAGHDWNYMGALPNVCNRCGARWDEQPSDLCLVEWAALAREETLRAKRPTGPRQSLADQIEIAQLRRVFNAGRTWRKGHGGDG